MIVSNEYVIGFNSHFKKKKNLKEKDHLVKQLTEELHRILQL